MANEKYGRMVLMDHLEECLSEGFIFALVLQQTRRLRKADIPEVLRLFSLTHMPNFILLISVEGCNYVKGSDQSLDLFPVKIPVEAVLREVLTRQGCEFVAYSVSNTDRIIAMLYQEVDQAAGDYHERLSSLAKTVIRETKERTGEDIAITISQPCDNPADFPKVYSACRDSYRHLFTDAGEAVRFVDQRRERNNPPRKERLNQYRAELVGAISSFDPEQLRHTLDEIVNGMLGDGVSSSRFKLHIVDLISRMTDYYGDFMTDRKAMEAAGVRAAHIILDAKYATTIKTVAFDFFWKITQNLRSLYRPREIMLKQHLEQCFASNYQNAAFNIAEAAKSAGYNVTYFGKLFKKIYHVSFNSYLSEYRVNRSKLLLSNTSLPINRVSESVGFSNDTYYYTVFKSINGVTPQQYRNGKRVDKPRAVHFDSRKSRPDGSGGSSC